MMLRPRNGCSATGLLDPPHGVEVGSRDEIGELGQSFNRMARELTDRDEALDVAQRQLVQSEKMASLGQLTAGIAHDTRRRSNWTRDSSYLALRTSPRREATRAEATMPRNDVR